MKITDIVRSRPVTISCELFPPKKDSDFAGVAEAAGKIATLRPDFISITYGAGGGTRKNTVEIASMVQEEFHVTSIAHLTCFSSTPDEVDGLIENIKAYHIENILALRGDPPKDNAQPLPGYYQHACQLIEQIRRHGDFCIGGACYPEGHVECANRELDLDYLKMKVDAGCSFLTTQMFFDNNILYRFLYRALAKGIDVPIFAGIMPVINAKQIKRSVQLSGTELPNRFIGIIDKFGDDPQAMKQAGIAYATEQIIDLIANGVKGIHLYTMNRPEVAAAIFHNLSHILGRDDV